MTGKPRRLFFTRLGVLATAWLAVTVCDNPDASGITEPQQAAHVMACCLMMNELTSSTAPLTGVADLLVHQLANHNAMAHYDFRADLLRSLEVFKRNRVLLAKHPGTVDFAEEFSRATGLSPRQFIELCLVIGTPYRMMNAGSLIVDDPTFFIDKNRFGNMKLSDADHSSGLLPAQHRNSRTTYRRRENAPSSIRRCFSLGPSSRRQTANGTTAAMWRA